MTDDEPGSSPCFAHELAFGERGYETVDRQTWIDVSRWRISQRKRLITARLAMSAAQRADMAAQICHALDSRVDPSGHPVIGVYWPFRGELDLRSWMKSISQRGAKIALPVVIEKNKPLIFRAWHPGCRMERGVWNIPVPSQDKRLIPDIVISPLVGWSCDGYRLGNGGGYYDRTLADLNPRPLTIGVGVEAARLQTIFPQPHDIPLDVILTEAGERTDREAG